METSGTISLPFLGMCGRHVLGPGSSLLKRKVLIQMPKWQQTFRNTSPLQRKVTPNWTQWQMCVMPATGEILVEDWQVEPCLDSLVSPCLKRQNRRKTPTKSMILGRQSYYPWPFWITHSRQHFLLCYAGIPAHPLHRLGKPICPPSSSPTHTEKTLLLPIPLLTHHHPLQCTLGAQFLTIYRHHHAITPRLSSIKPPCFSPDVWRRWPPPVGSVGPPES